MKEKIKEFIIKNLKWIILFICLIGFLELAEDVFNKEIMNGDIIGYKIVSTFLISDFTTPIAKFVTNLGGAIFIIALAIVLFIVIKNKKVGISIFTNLAIITILNQLLKRILQRPRPTEYRIIEETGYSFPSGHSMISMAFYGYLIYLIYKYIENKYGKEEAKERIIATTDKHKGTLKELADKEGYEEFVVPDDIGGRFSVFTAVGLLPLALAGVDIKALMEGAKMAYNDYSSDNLLENDAYKYAVARRILENQGYKSEMFVTYNLQLTMVAEWWKQLFGESEGKDGKGLLPTSACFSTDLHSLGQFIQEGSKVLYETLFLIDNMPEDITFPSDEENLDNMNYLAGKQVSWVNEMAMKGTLKAHSDNGDVPNILVHLEDNSAKAFGYMIYFFFKACGMSCYLLGVNPFNQPGVEVYKKEMFKLLGKN